MKRFVLTAVALLVGSVAMAQGQGGPPQGGPGGFGGQGGGFGPGGPGGGFPGGPGGPGGMMGMPREISAASIPLRALSLYLNLSDTQTAKIALIREDMQEAMRPQMQQPQRRQAQRDPNADPSQPQQARRGNNNNPSFQVAERKATTETTALLSESQRSRLNVLVKALKGLQEAGIRPDAASKLQLSDDQLSKLASGRALENVLSTEQQQVAQSYQMPQGGPGGPGGFPGGPGGPPPGFGAGGQ